MARILVVDDDQYLRKIYKKLFKRLSGDDIDTAEDLATAKDLVNKNEYELVFTDNDYPDVLGNRVTIKGAGLELLLHVSQISPNCARVLTSGHNVDISNHPYVHKFYEKGNFPPRQAVRELINDYL